MVDGFDYLSYIRPWTDDFLYLCLQELRTLRSTGGYRFRPHVTELQTGPGSPNAANTVNVNIPLAPGESRDFYIGMVPGSVVWGISVYCQCEPDNLDFLGQRLTPQGEVELIDAQTGESWWRTSQDAGSLRYQPFTDMLASAVLNGAGLNTEGCQMHPGFSPILGGRVILGDGQVMVRCTNNFFPATVPPQQQTGASLTSMQVALYCFEPLPNGGNS